MKSRAIDKIKVRGLFICLPGAVGWSWFNILNVVGVKDFMEDRQDQEIKHENKCVLSLTSGAHAVIMIPKDELADKLCSMTEALLYED